MSSCRHLHRTKVVFLASLHPCFTLLISEALIETSKMQDVENVVLKYVIIVMLLV